MSIASTHSAPTLNTNVASGLQAQIGNHLARGTGTWTSGQADQTSLHAAALDKDTTIGLSFLAGSTAILGLAAGVVSTARAHALSPASAQSALPAASATLPLTSAALADHNARLSGKPAAAGEGAAADTVTGQTIQSSLLRRSSVHSGSTVRLVSPTSSHFADHDSADGDGAKSADAVSVALKRRNSDAASHDSSLPASPRLIIPPSPSGSHDEHSLPSSARAERAESTPHITFRA